MKKQMILTLVLALTLLAMPGQNSPMASTAFPLLPDVSGPDMTQGARPDGQTAWPGSGEASPLNGDSAYSLATANNNAQAGNTFYVDGINGNDNWDGKSLSAAWKTIHKANQTLLPGDTVYIRGGTYYVGEPLTYPGASTLTQGINPKNSGAPGQPITYANYGDEDVQFAGTSKHSWAVKLFNGIQDNPVPTDYIVVKGLHFSNFNKFLWILKSSHCEVAYCSFQKSRPPDAGEVSDWRGSTLYKNAQYNHIHHCTFSEYGDFIGLNDNGALLEIGNEYAPAKDLTSFNLIEDCHLYHSGHHVVGLMGNNNVLRNNYIHNENWWDDGKGHKWGNRIVYMQSDDSGEGVMYNRRNLVEGNRIAFGGETAETIDPNDYQLGGGGISKFSMPYNIVRKNMLYYTLLSGMFFQTYHHGNVVYNHVYHNVFFRNGYSDNPKIGNADGHAILFNFNQGFTSANPPCIYEQYGNCIKNNLFHDNRNRSNKTEPILGHCYAGARIYPPFPTNTIENNWKEAGDPLFVDDGGPMDPSFKHDGTPEIDPFGPQPDFHLRPESPCIDAGGSLTQITSTSGSGTQFQVKDAGYFMDGWGIEHVQGDEIQLAGSTQRARVIHVDYDTNVITVDRVLTWTQNQGISLAYEGAAPDIGAYEFAPELDLRGIPANQAIHLSWTVNITLPITSTWRIDYTSQTGSAYLPVTGLISATRAYTLTGLTNGVWYTVTLNAMQGSAAILSDSVRVMPMGQFVYLPLVLRAH